MVHFDELLNIKQQNVNERNEHSLILTEDIIKTQNDNDQDYMSSFKERIEKLKLLHESGLISEEEFENKRQELLNSI